MLVSYSDAGRAREGTRLHSSGIRKPSGALMSLETLVTESVEFLGTDFIDPVELIPCEELLGIDRVGVHALLDVGQIGHR